MVAQYIVTCTIMDLCLSAERNQTVPIQAMVGVARPRYPGDKGGAWSSGGGGGGGDRGGIIWRRGIVGSCRIKGGEWYYRITRGDPTEVWRIGYNGARNPIWKVHTVLLASDLGKEIHPQILSKLAIHRGQVKRKRYVFWTSIGNWGDFDHVIFNKQLGVDC